MSVYEEMAAALDGCILVCRDCGATEHPSRGDLVSYLRWGWPQCCDDTMRLRMEALDHCVDRRTS